MAVLGRPDIRSAWDNVIEKVQPLELDAGQTDDEPTRDWLLSLERQWVPCTIQIKNYDDLEVNGTVGCIAAGMSGSPILSDNGRVVGVASIASNCSQAHLPSALPQWLVQQLTAARRQGDGQS